MKSHVVDLLVPEIPLDKAENVLVRNRATQKWMEAEGFRNVTVARIPVYPL